MNWGAASALAIDFADGWSRPEGLRPSEWATRYRRLSPSQSFAPGPMRHEQAPYLVGVMDVLALDAVQELWFEKAAQIGGSEALRTWMAWALDQYPGPMLLVLPDEAKGRKIFGDRILPLCREPKLAARLSDTKGDVHKALVKFTHGASIQLGWSGSASSLASDPARYTVSDEVDKFAPFAGRESDPISLIRARSKSWGLQAKRAFLGTPTTADGPIHVGREKCAVQLRYHVPCPACGVYQVMTMDQLRWPSRKTKDRDGRDEAPHEQADRIESLGLARYHCLACDKPWEEKQKAEIVQRGVWAAREVANRLAELARETPSGGIVTAGWPTGVSVGMQLNELPCLWVPWSQTAAAFLRAADQLGPLMEFRNQRMAEPFESRIVHRPASVFSVKSERGGAAGVLPAWTRKVLATADVQESHVYYVVRAWGPDYLSRRVAHGVLPAPRGDPAAFSLLYSETLGQTWPREQGGTRTADLLLIDARYRKEEVQRFTLRDLQRIRPIRGVDRAIVGWATARQTSYTPPHSPGRKFALFAYDVDVGQCKDWLAGQIEATVRMLSADGELMEHEAWQLAAPDDEDYNRQMASEQKVLIRRGMARPLERWVKVVEGAKNHYWDCEVYQRAAAHLAKVEFLTTGSAKRTAAVRPARERLIRREY